MQPLRADSRPSVRAPDCTESTFSHTTYSVTQGSIMNALKARAQRRGLRRDRTDQCIRHRHRRLQQHSELGERRQRQARSRSDAQASDRCFRRRGRWYSWARPWNPASDHDQVQEVNEAAAGVTIDLTAGRTRATPTPSLRDLDHQAAGRRRLRHRRSRRIGRLQAHPRRERERGDPSDLGVEHVSRLHHVGRQRPVLPHRTCGLLQGGCWAT